MLFGVAAAHIWNSLQLWPPLQQLSASRNIQRPIYSIVPSIHDNSGHVLVVFLNVSHIKLVIFDNNNNTDLDFMTGGLR